MRSADGHVGAVELGGSDGKKTLLDKPNAAGFVHERGEPRDAQLTRRENEKVAKGAISCCRNRLRSLQSFLHLAPQH